MCNSSKHWSYNQQIFVDNLLKTRPCKQTDMYGLLSCSSMGHTQLKTKTKHNHFISYINPSIKCRVVSFPHLIRHQHFREPEKDVPPPSCGKATVTCRFPFHQGTQWETSSFVSTLRSSTRNLTIFNFATCDMLFSFIKKKIVPHTSVNCALWLNLSQRSQAALWGGCFSSARSSLTCTGLYSSNTPHKEKHPEPRRQGMGCWGRQDFAGSMHLSELLIVSGWWKVLCPAVPCFLGTRQASHPRKVSPRNLGAMASVDSKYLAPRSVWLHKKVDKHF